MKLTKPAMEHTSDERQTIYRSLLADNKANLTPNCGRLSGQQVAYAKGRAWAIMQKLGF